MKGKVTGEVSQSVFKVTLRFYYAHRKLSAFPRKSTHYCLLENLDLDRASVSNRAHRQRQRQDTIVDRPFHNVSRE